MARVRGDGPTELTWDQELELLCGPWDDDRPFSPERSSFDSEAQRRQAWLDNAEQITEYCLRGQPWAAEHYEGNDR
jgi:hypothetical protein